MEEGKNALHTWVGNLLMNDTNEVKVFALSPISFVVPITYSSTTSSIPNMQVNSNGAIRRSTAVMATQALLDALEARVASLESA